jgi:predicted dehydrogenase
MRIGLVGYGTGGKNFHAPYIEAAADCELVGIVARAPATVARAQADWPETPIFDSLGEMIESGVDAVTISTPPATRRELVLEAVGRGVHVVADKPFAPSAAGRARTGQRGRRRRRAVERLSQPALGR